jgi:nucleotide-binding universal stress UspA family protein
MFKRIVVCSDGYDNALKAARMAAEIATKFDADIVLLNVFDPAFVTVPFVGAPEAAPSAEISLRYAQEAQQAIMERTGKVIQEVGARYKPCSEFGHPVDKIVSVAEEEQADLIVIGSRGLGGFQRFLLGSVSDGVLHHAHCPVLVVR